VQNGFIDSKIDQGQIKTDHSEIKSDPCDSTAKANHNENRVERHVTINAVRPVLTDSISESSASQIYEMV